MRELIAMRGSRYGAGVSWCIRRVIHIFNGCRTSSICAILVICLVHLSFVQAAVSGVNHNEFLAQLKVPQCRKDCTDKFSTDDLACLQKLDCSICDFPPYQFHNFPDAVNLMCWNNCAPRSSMASVVDHQATKADSPDTSDKFELFVRSLQRDKLLTMANIEWYANDPAHHQCLVTWEIFGGGIMGNLLTDTHEAELSLWPDSKYNIQVTCKNKNTNKMSKSLPILIDTTAASTTATVTTTTAAATALSSPTSKQNRRPEALIPSPVNGASVEMSKNVAEKRRPPSQSSSPSLQSHLNHANVVPMIAAGAATTTTPAHANGIDNNHDRQHDETEAIASITRQHNDQKQQQQQHEYNNDYQITTKPLYDAHQMSMHDSIATKVDGKNDNNDMESNSIVHGTLTASRDAAKLSKISSSWSSSSTLSSSKTAKITHTHIETMLTVVLLALVLIVAVLVIYTVASMRQRIKSNKHCDKTNLISSSASCSSTTSINDCEMDFNGSTASSSIAQLTAIHV